MSLSRNTRDALAVVAGLLFLLVFAVAIIFSIWLQFFASCEYVDWMPTKDVPARCLPGGGR